jgi:hypothetical protein
MVSFITATPIQSPFLTVALHQSGTRKAIFWLVIVYSKQLPSQCNLTAQIEPVQDLKKIIRKEN